MTKNGAQFLHRKNSQLHTSQPVLHEQARRFRAGEETHVKPALKISDWMEVLERVHRGHRDDPRVLQRIKEIYHTQYVIKPEDVPESAFLLEQRIARNLGHGTMEIDEEFKQQKREQIITDQKNSLDSWVNYLTHEDAVYPTWALYFAFTSVVAMGTYEKTEHDDGTISARFTKRTHDTVASFPILNAAAFALTIGALSAQLDLHEQPKHARTPLPNMSVKLNDEKFKQLLSTENFSKLYAQFLLEQPMYSTEGLSEIRGRWTTYECGSEPDELVASLAGYPLEWCIRDIGTARSYLAGGDMHIYYSMNTDGEPTVPRLAIAMNGDAIREVKGIAVEQNIDPYIAPVIEKKMTEFPDGKKYQKMSADMKRVTEIDERIMHGGRLLKDELRFLYEIDRNIEGFGYARDPRIETILKGRDKRDDLAMVFDCTKDQISITEEEALRGNIRYHYGDLDLYRLTSAEGLTLPESIGGYLSLYSLTSADGLTLPGSVGGNLNLASLTSAKGLTLPGSVGGDLNLYSLTSAKGLTLPGSVGGDLDLLSLTSANGLTLPESVGGNLNLSSLTSAKGLILPGSVGGHLDISSLTSADGLTLPRSVGVVLDLHSLTSANGLTLPGSVGGNLDLSSLTSANGLILPESVGGYLDLSNLTSANGLTLPESVGGGLKLSNLTSANGLTLPESVGGDLFLNSLTSAEGLILPKSVGGYVYLNYVPVKEKKELQKKYPAHNII